MTHVYDRLTAKGRGDGLDAQIWLGVHFWIVALRLRLPDLLGLGALP